MTQGTDAREKLWGGGSGGGPSANIHHRRPALDLKENTYNC